jgi:hypothetical protein
VTTASVPTRSYARTVSHQAVAGSGVVLWPGHNASRVVTGLL